MPYLCLYNEVIIDQFDRVAAGRVMFYLRVHKRSLFQLKYSNKTYRIVLFTGLRRTAQHDNKLGGRLKIYVRELRLANWALKNQLKSQVVLENIHLKL